MKKLLLVAAHPDDELLGCGGALLYYQKLGYSIKTVFLSDGESSRFIKKNQNKKLIKIRENQAKKVSKICKFHSPVFARFPDNQLDTIKFLKIVKFLENEIKKFKPEIILTHNEDDLNIDHKITCKAVITATRPSTKTFVHSIYCFETPSSTENNFSKVKVQFNPNLYIEISNYIKKKIKLLKMFVHTQGLLQKVKE